MHDHFPRFAAYGGGINNKIQFKFAQQGERGRTVIKHTPFSPWEIAKKGRGGGRNVTAFCTCTRTFIANHSMSVASLLFGI